MSLPGDCCQGLGQATEAGAQEGARREDLGPESWAELCQGEAPRMPEPQVSESPPWSTPKLFPAASGVGAAWAKPVLPLTCGQASGRSLSLSKASVPLTVKWQ